MERQICRKSARNKENRREKKMSVNLRNLCADEYQKIIFEVDKVTNNINNYIKNNNRNTKEFFIQVLSDVEEVCNCWTGKTYV